MENRKIPTLATHIHLKGRQSLLDEYEEGAYLVILAEPTTLFPFGQATMRRLLIIEPLGETPAHLVLMGATISPIHSVEPTGGKT